MKTNRKLLLIKAHYFLTHGGYAPIAPFLPLIGRGMGFSSLITGLIFAGVPIASVVAKPFISSINKIYHCHKLSFLGLIIIQMLFYFGVQYVPSLPTKNSITKVKCANETVVNICSLNSLSDDYINNFTSTYINRNLYCLLACQDTKCLFQQLMKNTSLNSVEDSVENDDYKEDLGFLNGSYQFKSISSWKPGYFPIKVSIATSPFVYADSCITLNINWLASHELKWLHPKCDHEITSLCDFHCGEIFYEFIHNPVIPNKKILNFYQFWLFLTVVMTGNAAFHINNSIGDSMCMNFLEDGWEQFANMRLWGSLGLGLVSIFSGGLIDKLSEGSMTKDISVAFYISLGFYIMDFLVCVKLEVTKEGSQKTSISHIDVKHVPVLVFMLWCALVGLYTSIADNFLFWYLEDVAAENASDLTFMKTIEGLILAVKTHLGDFPAFFLFGSLLKNIGRMYMMTFVLFAFGVSFVSYSYLTNPWWSLPISILDGITFGLQKSLITVFGNAVLPKGSESSIDNSVYGQFNSFGISIGSIIGGYLMQTYGGSLVFWVFGLSALSFCILYIVVQFFLKGSLQDIKKEETPKQNDFEETEKSSISTDKADPNISKTSE